MTQMERIKIKVPYAKPKRKALKERRMHLAPSLISSIQGVNIILLVGP